MNCIIIGAGPAGLTAAYELVQRTPHVLVLEAGNAVGGLARSFSLWGQTVDVGPHRFFSRDRRVNELWLKVVGRDYVMVERQTRILYDNQLYRYPLEANDVLVKLGPVEAAKCLFSYAAQWAVPTRQDGSFENWVCRRFGRRLFTIFFKTYSEKLWGISCSELDADFAAQRIKQFSLLAAIESAVLPSRKREHRTLADEFGYPVHGSGMVYERMAEAIRAGGGEVRLNSPVEKVTVERGRVVGVQLTSGKRLTCDHVISTMPLTTLVRTLDGAPADVVDACHKLRFRNTILVYLEVLRENPFPDNWIYVHSPNLRFGRVTNFRNWAPQLYGESPNAILALEYWCNEDDEFWHRTDTALSALAKEEIVASGLVSDLAKLGRCAVIRVPKCYPMYKRGYQILLEPIKGYLRNTAGLQVIGRYGSFKYNNQDHSILMGLLAADNCLSGPEHDLWDVNADYDSYQESSSVEQSGLVAAS